MRPAIPMQDVVKSSVPPASGDGRLCVRWRLGAKSCAARSLLCRHAAGEKILAESPAEWQRLAPRIGVDGADALKSIVGDTSREFHAGRSPMKRPTRRRSTACSPRSAAPNSSARPRRSIPARSTARDRTNEPPAASRLGGAAARRRGLPARTLSGRACCRSHRW